MQKYTKFFTQVFNRFARYQALSNMRLRHPPTVNKYIAPPKKNRFFITIALSKNTVL